jgi:NADPH:quinone reductase-like Zn-dependent oxidoreductase
MSLSTSCVAANSLLSFLQVLRRGGRYAAAGAIAGPIVELDLRTLYLTDLRLLGCTIPEPGVFKDLVGYIERGEIRPLIARTYPLARSPTRSATSSPSDTPARSFCCWRRDPRESDS